jgi:DNA-binding NtrC family response regulator
MAELFPPATLEEMMRHPWPGNVRELRNVVLGAVAMGDPHSMLHAAVPPVEPTMIEPVTEDDVRPYRVARQAVVDQFERQYVTALLERTNGNIRAAAREARMDRSYLMELIKRHQLR